MVVNEEKAKQTSKRHYVYVYVLFLKVDDYISNVILRISNFVADYIS